ncbi:IQ domain-containing protein C-like isoform X4 [Corvus hawaiiensis]|uniref:IQ domain-containing protein C-like isoform X4 n=1 Tax=Corvus hawaiiensis TaxID=134902 RepID=UPI002019FD8C|nr:IQ domain-containing protein C-like isoform X4 [Corvus hawaiiensis]
MVALVAVTVALVALVMTAVTWVAMVALVAVSVALVALVMTAVTWVAMVALVAGTVLALPLDPLSDRSCTWPRARTPRTLRPDPGPAPGPAPAPATPGRPNRARPGPSRHGGAGGGPMTSAGGAGAMAAALGPRAGTGTGTGAEAEAEGRRRRLLRAVTRLQAAARGFLLRRRLRSVREEFEAVVLEIEGDLSHLRWSGRVLQLPRFGPEPLPGKLLDPGKAAENNETIPKKPLEKPDPPGPERAGGCGNTPSSAPLPSGTTPNPPNLGSGADKIPGKEGRAWAGSEEWDNDSEWDSSDLGASPEIPADLRGVPRSELQSYRKHLLMELLWIQQAIASRKNFLLLKRKLGIPERSGGIPEFLDWFGEALELQQRS